MSWLRKILGSSQQPVVLQRTEVVSFEGGAGESRIPPDEIRAVLESTQDPAEIERTLSELDRKYGGSGDVHVSTGPDAERDAPPEIAELEHELEQARSAEEAKAIAERFAREHRDSGQVVSSFSETSEPTPELLELQRELEAATDPAERQAIAERFAREHGYTVKLDESSDDER